MASKVLFCRQEKATAAAFRSLRAKNCNRWQTVFESKIIIFVLNYLTVLVYTKTIIHLSVGGQWWYSPGCFAAR